MFLYTRNFSAYFVYIGDFIFFNDVFLGYSLGYIMKIQLK